MEKWIFSCNCKYYDVIGAFENYSVIDWKQSNTNVQPGDEVYIYVGQPYQAVMFRCRVNKTNMANRHLQGTEFVKNKTELDGEYGRYMELELIEKYDDQKYSIDILKSKGLKGTIQGPRKAGKLLD
jgi:5-methylcytosine-specific restriction protein A